MQAIQDQLQAIEMRGNRIVHAILLVSTYVQHTLEALAEKMGGCYDNGASGEHLVTHNTFADFKMAHIKYKTEKFMRHLRSVENTLNGIIKHHLYFYRANIPAKLYSPIVRTSTN